MSLCKSFNFISTLLLLCFLSVPQSALACSACYGQSDSKLAEGMNWGILTLLVVVTFVLAAISGFFVYIAKRASTSSEKI